MALPTFRAYHQIDTPRLIIRSAVRDDAQEIAELRGKPENNPFTPVEPNLSAEVFENRIIEWTASAERGENAFMVIILRDTTKSPADSTVTNGYCGTLIGFGGFNSFNYGPALDGSAEKVLIADTGCMIDHIYWREGYAREALCASVEYALHVLGCEHITIDTSIDNKPWRELMRSVGLGDVEEKRSAGNDGELEWVYKFGRDAWRNAKADMIARGIWML